MVAAGRLSLVFVASALLFSVPFIGGCVVMKPSPAELAALDDPPPAVEAKLDAMMPLVLPWYRGVETALIDKGAPLTEKQIAFARTVGVKDPASVRVLVTDTFPMPSDPRLQTILKGYGLGGGFEGGRTHGHLILLKPKYAKGDMVVSHELVHVGQFDRLGWEAMARRYLTEIEMLGYTRAPLELEAYARQRERL